MSRHSATIFALASARGRAGIAVVRLSGPGAFVALERLTRRPLPGPRKAVLRRLRHLHDGELLDHALVLCFPAPASFTGEDVVELHLHGGRAVVAGVLEALSAIPGLRPAEPGEYSRRAFDNGRMDLTAAEALSDLVMAETASQRRLALRQAGGALHDLYEGWRHRLLGALGRVEAAIDFADEELPDDLFDHVRREAEMLGDEIAHHLADGRRGERVRDGVTIVLTGAPNVGKSSLLNALAKRDIAIVSDIPGTTRDAIELSLDLGGYAVTLVDTAGIGDPRDALEAEGMRRARARADQADLRLCLFEAGNLPPGNLPQGGLDAGEYENDRDIIVVTKIDLYPATSPGPLDPEARCFAVSAHNGAGLADLLRSLEEKVIALSDVGEAPVLTRMRHRRSLETCCDALAAFLAAPADEPALACEDLRIAVRALGSITGRVDIEDMLDIVFSEFCIGK